MMDFIKKEIEFFVKENKDNYSFEDFMKLVYEEYPRFEEMGYAMHVYFQSEE